MGQGLSQVKDKGEEIDNQEILDDLKDQILDAIRDVDFCEDAATILTAVENLRSACSDYVEEAGT